MSKFKFETEGLELVREFHDQVKGCTFFITGPSEGGIGAETAITLAHSNPSQLILLGRSLLRAQPTIDTIQSLSPSTTVKFIPVDLSSPSSVRSAALTILSDPSIPHINIIINNASIMAPPYTLTPEGFESQLASNYLGHFLLTNLLLPKLPPSSRIINVSSGGNRAGGVRFNDPNYTAHPEEYTPFNAYGQSKTALVLFSIALNKRLASTRGIRSWALNPGSIETNLGTYMTPQVVKDAIREVFGEGGELPPRKTLQQGCATTLRAALDPTLEDEVGVYLHDCQLTTDPQWVAPWALDEEGAEKCWELSEDLVGEKFDL